MKLKHYKLALYLLIGLSLFSCSKDSEDDSTPAKSKVATLRTLELVYQNSVFSTTISGSNVALARVLPYNADKVTISAITLSTGATASVKVGDQLAVDDVENVIEVTAENGIDKQSYTLAMATQSFESIVAKHGLLKVSGSKIVDKNGQAVSLAGNSFFWSNDGWGGNKYYTSAVVSWLKLDWGTTIVRAAMGVDESGGYISSKDNNVNRVKTIVDAAIAQGLYVIIDWHSHHAEDYSDEAVTFFKEMASLYGAYDNVIYEIYNEPLAISWDATLKPYAEKVIAAIRDIDTDNLIVVGTPEWSQRVDLAAANPIDDPNVAYTLHFYAVNHKQWLRDRATATMNSGIALVVTEWGSIGYTQNDPETQLWMNWCRSNNLIHCSWAVNDKAEEWSIVNAGASTAGKWKESDLTESGKLGRTIVRSWMED